MIYFTFIETFLLHLLMIPMINNKFPRPFIEMIIANRFVHGLTKLFHLFYFLFIFFVFYLLMINVENLKSLLFSLELKYN